MLKDSSLDFRQAFKGFSRSSHPQEFLGKGDPKICCKFTGEYPCRNVISIKVQNNFIEITPWHGRFTVNSYIFSEYLLLRTPLDDWEASKAFFKSWLHS